MAEGAPAPRAESEHEPERTFSRAFAGRNSLRTGNLTGKSKNTAEFALFGLQAGLDRTTYQDIRHDFPVPGDNRNFCGITRNFRRETWNSF
jgi:hypothetical protein